MPWTPNDAERHTHKATTCTLKELWAKVANESLNEPATKVAPSGKQTLWSHGRLKQAGSGAKSERDCVGRQPGRSRNILVEARTGFSGLNSRRHCAYLGGYVRVSRAEAPHQPSRYVRALPTTTRESTAERFRLDSRDQARRLPHPSRRRSMATVVQLITRNGYDFAERYRLIVDAIRRLSVKSCIVDGEAIVVDQEGLSVFDLLRYRRHDHAATLCAFDLIELDGADLRRSPIEERKRHLAELLRQPDHGIALNQTYEGDGAVIYEQACALGCEGIVSKRLGSAYRMGRTDQWLKIKNPSHQPSGASVRSIGPSGDSGAAGGRRRRMSLLVLDPFLTNAWYPRDRS